MTFELRPYLLDAEPEARSALARRKGLVVPCPSTGGGKGGNRVRA